MILVTGGNGQIGRKLINRLSEQKVPFAVTVRDLNKAQDLLAANMMVKQADYEDRDSLARAFVGVDKLFLISADGPAQVRIRQHQNAIAVAKQCGIQHIFYTSFIDVAPNSPFEFSQVHAQTESDLKESGLNYTILRNNLYSDLLLMVKLSETGHFSLPAEQGKVAFISRNDIATFAATVLAQPSDMHCNQIYQLTGPRSYSYSEIADLLTQRLKREVYYRSGTVNDFIYALTKAGLPEWKTKSLAGMYQAIAQEELGYGQISSDFERIVGYPAQDVQDFMKML